MPAPINWTPELEQAIIDWIADGKTLRDFCRQPDMPSFCAVYDHEKLSESFKIRFAHAREIGEDVIGQECITIANTPQIGRIVTEKPDGSTEIKTEDMLGHRKLQIETRLKLLAKWNPRKWGERVQNEHTGEIGIKTVLVQPDAKVERDRPAVKPEFED